MDSEYKTLEKEGDDIRKDINNLFKKNDIKPNQQKRFWIFMLELINNEIKLEKFV